MKRLEIRFNNEGDRDIVEHLGKISNASDYIRTLVRRDIVKSVTSQSSVEARLKQIELALKLIQSSIDSLRP
jgi:Arc/MetJ-type ribon-helix-helix transcriptional regulator